MMKRRVFGMLLSLCLTLALIPAAAFAEDEEPTFTLPVPYTTTVKLGGNVEPGETVFKLKLMDNEGKNVVFSHAEITGTSVTTNGEGSYNSVLTLSVSFEDLIKLYDGIFVQQVDEGKKGWEYDDKVWYVQVQQAASRAAQDDAAAPHVVLIYPAQSEETGDGNWYYIPTGERKDEMTFTNTYTKSASEPTNPDDASSDANVSALPKTGDSSNLTGWLILLAVSAAAVAGAVVYSRRRKNARE